MESAITAMPAAKERVLLLNPPGTRFYARDKYCSSICMGNYYWPQIDLLVLSGRLKTDYDVTLLDAIVSRRKPATLLSQLAAQKFKAVIFLTSMMSFEEDFEFIKALKNAWPETEMIGNGGLLLIRGERILERNSFLDAVLLDFTTEHILNYLAGQRPVADMIARTNGRIVQGGIRRSSTFSYPVPLHDQLGRGRYLMPIVAVPRFTVSLTSSGCRFGCVFCVPNHMSFRLREQDNVIEELLALERSGFTHVLFHDINFVSDREYVIRLCRRILENRVTLKWAFQTRVDAVDGEILALVQQAGCRAIEYGVESGDDCVLREMNKGISVEQIRQTFLDTHRHGIRSVGFFIIGMPGETRETIRKTIDLAIEIDCDYASFSLPLPHPGTELGESMSQKGQDPSECSLFGGVFDPNGGSLILEQVQARKMRAMAYRKFYLRPSYFLKRIKGTKSVFELWLHVCILSGILKSLVKLWSHEEKKSPVTSTKKSNRGQNSGP